jgi:lysozyme
MIPQQIDELRADEGTRLLVYDDGTGHPIGPGSVLKGHPSIGIGRALDVHGISSTEAVLLNENDIASVEAALSRLDWYPLLDPVRQGVMCNLAFNMGVRGLESFTHMLREIEAGEHDLSASMNAMAAQDFEAAAQQLAASKWATQVQPSRRDRLIAQLRTGMLVTPPGTPHVPLPPEIAPQPAMPNDDEADALNEAEIQRITGEC